MGIIFYMSAQPAIESSETSNGVGQLIYYIIRLFIPGFSMNRDEFLIRYMPLIRKLAHFSEFFVLGILTSLVYEDFYNKISVLNCMLFGFLYACSDEIHQLFVVNRYCSFKDVMIDFSGVFIAVLVCHFIYEKWIKSTH